jgi:hypothetical protein
MVRGGGGSCRSYWRQVANSFHLVGFCEDGNEHSAFINFLIRKTFGFVRKTLFHIVTHLDTR